MRELVRESAARQHEAARAGHNAVSYFANRLLSGAKRRAKEKGIEIDIDKGWIMEKLIRGTCEATGLQFAYEGRSEEHSRNPWQPSLDRIDNAKATLRITSRLSCGCSIKQKANGLASSS